MHAGMVSPPERRRLTLARRFPDFDTEVLHLMTVRRLLPLLFLCVHACMCTDGEGDT